MSDYDQHGNRFPDHNHLQHWPSDAYPDAPPVSGTLPLTKNMILAAFGTSLICTVLFILNYIHVVHERVPEGSPVCSYDANGQLKIEPCKVTVQSAVEERAIRTKTEAEMSRILQQMQQRKGEAK